MTETHARTDCRCGAPATLRLTCVTDSGARTEWAACRDHAAVLRTGRIAGNRYTVTKIGGAR